MGIGKKSRAVWKPGSGDDLPGHIVILERLRLRNGLGLVGSNEFDVHSLGVGICEVSSIGRNRPTRHQILGGIDGELLKLQIRKSLTGRRLASHEPEDRADDQQYDDASK